MSENEWLGDSPLHTLPDIMSLQTCLQSISQIGQYLENAGTMTSVPQPSGLISTIFRDYRNHFGLFWRVMLPIIVFSLIFWFLFFKFGAPEAAQWTFSTSAGIDAESSSTFDKSSGTFQPSPPKPTGVDLSTGFSMPAFGIGWLWLALSPLALIIVYHHRGVDLTSGAVWQEMRRRCWSILGVYLLLFLVSIGAGILLLPLALSSFLADSEALFGFLLLFMAIAGVATLYFLVEFSLANQCLIIENLSVIAALRRSSELVRRAWGRLFGMYALLSLVTLVFTTAVFGLTLLLFSIFSAEFAPLREVLQSGKFFSIFFGVQVSLILDHTPIWAICGMVTVTTLIHAVLAPIWALLTTHLYMERAGIQQNAVSH